MKFCKNTSEADTNRQIAFLGNLKKLSLFLRKKMNWLLICFLISCLKKSQMKV